MHSEFLGIAPRHAVRQRLNLFAYLPIKAIKSQEIVF